MENIVLSDTSSDSLSALGDIYSSTPMVYGIIIVILVVGAILIWNEDIEQVYEEEKGTDS